MSSRRRSLQRSPDLADTGAKVAQIAGVMRRGGSGHGSHQYAAGYLLPLRATTARTGPIILEPDKA